MIAVRVLLSVALCLAVGCQAFVAPARSSIPSTTSLFAAKTARPTFDKKTQRWSPASEEESAANAYDTLGTLLRQGPKAYFTRVSDPDLYDQACLKFMAQEGCSYQLAQGNLDRMNENAQDWMYERMEAEKAGRIIDYVKLDKKQVALTTVWSLIITAILGRAAYVYVTGESFNDILRSNGL